MKQSRSISLSMMRVIVALLAVVTLAAAVPTCSLKPGEAESATTTSSASRSSATSGGSGAVRDGRAGLQDEEVIATAWFAGWTAASFPPSAIPWSKYNMMTYAFA